MLYRDSVYIIRCFYTHALPHTRVLGQTRIRFSADADLPSPPSRPPRTVKTCSACIMPAVNGLLPPATRPTYLIDDTDV